MAYIKGIMLVCSMAVSASIQFHFPLVYEDINEYNSHENVRTARNSDSTYKPVYHPPTFNFASAKQQNNQKFRYAQQQKFALINGIAKSHRFIGQSQNLNYKSSPRIEDEEAGWQPFDPKLSRHNIKDTQNLFHFKTVNDIKLYKPGTVKVTLPRSDQNLSYKKNDDLETEASENIEKKIDIRDSSNEYNKLILVHSNQIQEHSAPHSEEKLGLEDDNISIKKPEGQLTVLNDLIGKNPNVQLEGLQRLLQTIPSMQGVDPFQSREHQDIANIPNPHLVSNHQDNTISLQTPAIDKDSFENIQKQLDEASKLQVQQVLARAQQEAQAHVDAQHKAIALAQVQARQVALDKLKKSLYGNDQTISLSETNEGEGYDEVTSVQHQEPQAEGYHDVPHPAPQALPLQANHNRPITSYNSIIQKQEHALTDTLGDNIKKLISQSRSKLHIPAQAYGSKELLYYAPNHNHQAAAQLQAEKAILAQVQAQNSVILQNHRNSPLRQILNAEIKHAEAEESSDIHSVTESQPQPTAYQHIILQSKEEEDAGEEQTDYDDHDDLQYAAKYAFGYRIKDAEEGNDFGHEERRNGKNLEGSYHVLLPDGRLQKVEYYADKSGYHAKVTYEHTNSE